MILWELFMGARPYSGLSHAQILYHVTSGQKPELGRSAPPHLQQLYQRCTAAAPEQRPAFDEICEHLRAQLAAAPAAQ
jgi:hypothetical protein